MELFKPSKKILEMICSDGKSVQRTYEIYPFGEYKQMDSLLIPYLVGTFDKILEFYELGLDWHKSRLSRQGISNVITEIFKNWADHSPESDFFTGLFLGDKGVCYGFHDGGDFFKSQEIKYQIENKINFDDFNKNPRGSCCNIGFNEYIFPYSDFIEVDSERGILYCVQLKENIIAPEGENSWKYPFNLKRKIIK
jgi:hypothetical protein